MTNRPTQPSQAAQAILAMKRMSIKAMPSINTYLLDTRIRVTAQSYYDGAQLARTEALRRNADVVITVSLSTNKSFEWTELDGDNKFEPVNGETVVDMGIRGMLPIVE